MSITHSIRLLIGLGAIALVVTWPIPSFSREGTNAPTVSGRLFEGAIEGILREKGFKIVPHSEWKEGDLYREPNARFVVKRAPYKSIYGSRTYIEFLLIAGDRQVLIEAKRQKDSGSTDEKFPYVFENARLNLPDREMILVIGGKGARSSAIAWVRAKAEETEGFYVMSIDQFIEWVKTEF